MKRKFLEEVAEKKAGKRKGYSGTCVRAGEYLVIDVWQEGDYVGRYAMNTETGEYGGFRDGRWQENRFLWMFGINPLYHYGESPMKWDTHEDMETCMEALKAPETDGRRWYDRIARAEEKYNHTKYRNAKERKYDRIRELMQQVPPLPDLENWFLQNDGEISAFWNREEKTCSCSACGEKFPRKMNGRDLRHGDQIFCPGCGRKITVRTRQKQIATKGYICVLQSMPPGQEAGNRERITAKFQNGQGAGIARHVRVTLTQDYYGRHFEQEELIRLMLYRGGGLKIYYDQDGEFEEWWSGLTQPEWMDTNARNRRFHPCILYPEGIRDALAGTDYESLTNGFEALAAAGVTGDYNKAMAAGKRIAGLGTTLEYLAKGRFYRLAGETLNSCDIWNDGQYRGPLFLDGKNQEEVFKICDRQKINRIRQQDGGENMTEWLQYADMTGEKIPQDTLNWLGKEKLSAHNLKNRLPQVFAKMTVTQIANYIGRQQVYYGSTEKVIEHWADYLSMCVATGKKLDDPLIYRPADLKKHHDELVMDMQKAEVARRLLEEPERREAEAQVMREKFPEAEQILEQAEEKYAFAAGGFLMRIPKDLVEIVEEGYALHHCGGSSDRYFNRICNRETYIGFLRRTSEPNLPFYTIEFEPDGTIRQNRSYYDEEPGIEEIRGFLRQWQQEVRKRMTRRDREDARKSAVLREENLKELREKKNTFVLKKLMEDFMEAG